LNERDRRSVLRSDLGSGGVYRYLFANGCETAGSADAWTCLRGSIPYESSGDLPHGAAHRGRGGSQDRSEERRVGTKRTAHSVLRSPVRLPAVLTCLAGRGHGHTERSGHDCRIWHASHQPAVRFLRGDSIECLASGNHAAHHAAATVRSDGGYPGAQFDGSIGGGPKGDGNTHPEGTNGVAGSDRGLTDTPRLGVYVKLSIPGAILLQMISRQGIVGISYGLLRRQLVLLSILVAHLNRLSGVDLKF